MAILSSRIMVGTSVGIQSGNLFWSSEVEGAMAAACANLLCAGVEMFGANSFSANCSSSLRLKSRIVSNVLQLRSGSTSVNNLQALWSSSSLSSVVRSEASSSDGAEQDQNPRLFSRRWATIAPPASAATLVSSIAFSNGEAMAEDVSNERRDVENGAGRVAGDVAFERRDVGNWARGGSVELRTLNGCGLGVARYPDFVYNAEGGGGTGKAQLLADGRTLVQFDTEVLYIPAVCFDTTTILGLPLPPGLKIEVVPKILEGYVEQTTGKVELNFLANFYFTAGSLYSAPPLVVDTKLTTESAQGEFRRGNGQRLDSSGNVKLVGVARLVPVNDLFLSTFLTLPTDCLAELSANLCFS